MANKLVIVESPAKAKTIGKILGKGYIIKASMGHVRDLPEKELGIKIEENFEPVYRSIAARRNVLEEIKNIAKEVSTVYLATDPDREGEAISWHLVKAAKLENNDADLKRVVFHEITKEAVEHAFKTPRSINMKLVDAQQARRVMDRLVGYKLSPLLWKKVFKGLSAGRVQSAAVRLVVDRERDILGFMPCEYWTITAELSQKDNGRNHFRAAFVGNLNGSKISINNKQECDALLKTLKVSYYAVSATNKKDVLKQPAPPFITSTLQQEAFRKLRFTAKRTMMIAQQLYEGLPLGDEGDTGLITYMRTDSTQMAVSAVTEIREYINNKYGQSFLPASPRAFQKKVKMAQEAHEAIRPTRAFREPESIKKHLNSDQLKLYELIWKRAIASQMSAAVYDTVKVDIGTSCDHDKQHYLFQASASSLRFQGFIILYLEGKDEENGNGDEEDRDGLPDLKRGETLNLIELLSEQHFTQPSPRFTEATLIKTLEQKGIGRPSTYAPIISTVLDREYVYKESGKLIPSEIGMIVNDLLVNNFSNIVDLSFTAEMEKELDEIASGKRKWVSVIQAFYRPFEKDLASAQENIQKVVIRSEELCPECGKPMVLKHSRYGKFLACSNYPECKGKKSLTASKSPAVTQAGEGQDKTDAEVKESCPLCGNTMVVRNGKFGRFLACSNYPECKGKQSLAAIKSTSATKQSENKPDKADEAVQEPCPLCGKNMVRRHSKFGEFLACSDYPKCKGKKSSQVEGGTCPDCGAELVQKWGRYGRFWACSKYPECKYIKPSFQYRKAK